MGFGTRHNPLKWQSSAGTRHAHKTVYPDKLQPHQKEVSPHTSILLPYLSTVLYMGKIHKYFISLLKFPLYSTLPLSVYTYCPFLGQAAPLWLQLIHGQAYTGSSTQSSLESLGRNSTITFQHVGIQLV